MGRGRGPRPLGLTPATGEDKLKKAGRLPWGIAPPARECVIAASIDESSPWEKCNGKIYG